MRFFSNSAAMTGSTLQILSAVYVFSFVHINVIFRNSHPQQL